MSAHELVDIIDENNNVIETVERHIMRRDSLPHRASYISLRDRQGKFLVEIRTLCKDYAPGLFDACIGGVMQHGEDEIESAKRELLEEVGVNADSDKVSFTALGTYCLPSSNGKYVYAYLYYAVADVITVRQISEVSGVMFIEESEILRLQESCTKDSVTAFKEIVSRAKEKGIY